MHNKSANRSITNPLAAALALRQFSFTKPTRVVEGFAPRCPTYTATLRPEAAYTKGDYQACGSSWLIEHPIGILGDDMGLGKTKQLIDALMHIFDHQDQFEPLRNVLVLTKASTVTSWMDEIARWAEDSFALAYRGADRKEQLATFMREWGYAPQFVVMSHSIYRQDYESIYQYEWDCAVIDESQMVRSSPLNGEMSQIGERIHYIKPPRRYLLSGTLIENTVADLWNQLTWLGVETRSWTDFAAETLKIIQIKVDEYGTKRNKIDDTKADGIIKLAEMIRGCMIRRTQEDEIDLPPIVEQTIMVPIEGADKKNYLAMKKQRDSALEDVAVGRHPSISPDIARLKLAQIASGNKAKMEAVEEIGREAIARGEKIIVFTSHIETLRMLWATFKEFGMAYIHGQVSTDARSGQRSDRQQMIDRFQNDADVKVMLCTYKAGGVGITLTAASTVILCDPTLEGAENQAVKRAQRIGQKGTVKAYRLIATIINKNGKESKTIEAEIARGAAKKGRVAESILG